MIDFERYLLRAPGRLIVLCLLVAVAGTAFGEPTGTHPRTGDQHREYHFAAAHELMPYRLYVPSTYNGSRAYPLIVVLHGSGSDDNEPFDRSDLRQLAQEKGYILVAPEGYSNFGGYGDIYPVIVTREMRAHAGELRALVKSHALSYPRATTAVRKPAAAGDYADLPACFAVLPDAAVLSEEDVMNVVKLVRQEYRIDSKRIYLMGNSMGGVGTLYLGVRYPKVWAALAPSGGPIAAWSYPYYRLRENHIAVLLVHGQLDEHSNAGASRRLASVARSQGVDASVLVMKGADHVAAWQKALPQTFDFFARHPKP